MIIIAKPDYTLIHAVPSPLMGEGGDEGEIVFKIIYPSPQSSPARGEEAVLYVI